MAEGLDPALAEFLVCPVTGQSLAVRHGALADLDEPRERAPDGALAREDGGAVYAVYEGVPDLFAADAEAGSERAATATGFSPERLARLAALEGWHFWFVGRRRLVDHILARYADGRPQLVLDVGCGTGSIVELLARRGHRVVGIDTDLDGLLATRRARPDGWFLRADGARLPFRPDTFDGVTVMDVLEHVDDEAVLREIRRVLKPRGWLLVTVPAVPWLWSHADEVAGHRRRYSRTMLRRLLETAGFEVELATAYQFLLLPLVAATRLLGRARHDLREREQQPSPALNRLLLGTTALELAAGRRIRWPWGSSLVALSRKRTAKGPPPPPRS